MPEANPDDRICGTKCLNSSLGAAMKDQEDPRPEVLKVKEPKRAKTIRSRLEREGM